MSAPFEELARTPAKSTGHGSINASGRVGVTMQISLAPTDLPTARHTVPHQIGVWGDQVDEILLVLDLHRSPGRYGNAWAERLPGMRRLIEDILARCRNCRAVEVDYSEDVVERLSMTYCGGARVPPKDYLGAPFHAYLFAIEAASHDLVFHLDSDMMYGGGSSSWLEQARHLLGAREDVFTVSPLPGPPTSDGSLRSQVEEREPGLPFAFRAASMSTRHFLIDRRSLRARLAPIVLTGPGARARIAAWLDGTPGVKSLEECLSDRMRAEGLLRIEFLGDPPGMWGVHPPYRSTVFYQSLPKLISAVERGTVPDGQRGCHDLNESMTDCTAGKTTRVQRFLGHLRIAGGRLLNLVRPSSA
jgi:hypothetical protein